MYPLRPYYFGKNNNWILTWKWTYSSTPPSTRISTLINRLNIFFGGCHYRSRCVYFFSFLFLLVSRDASLIIEAKKNNNNIINIKLMWIWVCVYVCVWVRNRISIQIQQINNHFFIFILSLSLFFHLKTISNLFFFSWRLQHQYATIWTDILLSFFFQIQLGRISATDFFSIRFFRFDY